MFSLSLRRVLLKSHHRMIWADKKLWYNDFGMRRQVPFVYLEKLFKGASCKTSKPKVIWKHLNGNQATFRGNFGYIYNDVLFFYLCSLFNIFSAQSPRAEGCPLKAYVQIVLSWRKRLPKWDRSCGETPGAAIQAPTNGTPISTVSKSSLKLIRWLKTNKLYSGMSKNTFGPKLLF